MWEPSRIIAGMETKRRGHGEDSIYFDHKPGSQCQDAKLHKACVGSWRGAISLGFGPDGKRLRRKARGRTKAEVRQKLQELRDEIREGVHTSATYTVRDAVDEWLAHGLEGRAPKTVTTNREVLTPLMALIGSVKLRALTAADVRSALARLAEDRSTRAVQMARAALVRAIRHAQANDLVARNVADLVTAPKGREGRPSKALTVLQATALLQAAQATRWYAYVVLCLLVGIRTEEARALRWDHVDLDGDPYAQPPVPAHVAVWRSVRSHGEVKTKKSRRTLRLPQMVVEVLRAHKARQAEERLKAGSLWQEHGLVFPSVVGTPLDPSHVRRAFKKLCLSAGIGANWTPRELRHTFVSIMSEHGVPIEEIARLIGHSVTTTTETVYRHELRPIISTGAEIMDTIFKAS